MNDKGPIAHILSQQATVDPLSAQGSRGPVFIYGAGNCGKDVLRVLQQQDIPVAGFLDMRVPQGTVADGIRVFRPDDIASEQRRQSCVIVAVFNRDASVRSIENDLVGLGYAQVVSFVEMHRQFSAELGERFWLASLDIYGSQEPMITQGLQVWHDDKSRDLYQALLRFRMTGKYEHLPTPEQGTIYFDGELPRWKMPIRFVDCGSYDGDTIREMHRCYGPVASIVAFEPDNANYSRLCRCIRKEGPFAENVVLVPCGTWSETKQLAFASDSTEASCLSSGGSHRVQCVALDEALAGFHPTHIKMDVEGAEYETLNGARAILAADRPDLAISLYHRPADLWRIPLLLQEWDLGYRHFLRMYGHSGFDIVMYAVKESA